MEKSQLKQYPTPTRTRSGNKVSWNYYTNKKDTRECALAAKHNAEIRERQGYDFGYLSPGSIHTLDSGEFEVCLP